MYHKQFSSPVVSIVMPVHNAENTLEGTLHSVLAQTMKQYELILVDDGSTDRTASIAEKYRKRDSRITVLSTKNTGPARARNQGLAHACGQYVFFMDADDWIAPEALSAMLEEIRKEKAQVAVFGFTRRDGEEKTCYQFPVTVIGDKRQLSAVLPGLYRSGLLNPVWNKLYDRELLREHRISFPDVPYGEDRLFVFDVLRAAGRVCISPQCFYEYRVQRGGSLVTRYLPQKFELCCHIDDAVRRLARENGEISEEGEAIFSHMFLKSVLSCISVLYTPTCPLRLKYKYREVRRMVRHPQVRACLKTHGDPRCNQGLLFSIGRIVLKSGWVLPNLLLGWGISKAQRIAPRIFLRAKK